MTASNNQFATPDRKWNMKKLILTFCVFVLASCGGTNSSINTGADEAASNSATATLEAILDSQTDAMKKRYAFRNPKETLEFFGIEPGMTVVEALPGGGWYTKLLVPYLGSEGKLVGANYAMGMWSFFGYKGERLDNMKKWPQTWPAEINDKSQSSGGASAAGFMFGDMPDSMKETADAVLLIRAVHNLARFESQGGFLTAAIQNTFDILKPGGVVGIVQHQARDEMPDEWADGSKGYLKKSFVIDLMERTGFELVGESDINQNPKDQPTAEDIVWRLPPSLATSKDNDELKNSLESIGESNRMTLKFKKPV